MPNRLKDIGSPLFLYAVWSYQMRQRDCNAKKSPKKKLQECKDENASYNLNIEPSVGDTVPIGDYYCFLLESIPAYSNHISF